MGSILRKLGPWLFLANLLSHVETLNQPNDSTSLSIQYVHVLRVSLSNNNKGW